MKLRVSQLTPELWPALETLFGERGAVKGCWCMYWRTDTYHGRFVRLVPNEQVVQVMEFETADEAMRGEMTVSFTLSEAHGGTGLLAVHDDVPPGVAPADNELGWRMSLGKLARLVEAGQEV